MSQGAAVHRLTAALALAQLLCWATCFTALAVLARPIARDLALPLPWAMAGSSLFLIAMALTSPRLAPLLARRGPGPVLAAGAPVAALAFALLALAQGPVLYAAGWLVMGLAGAMMLSTTAHGLLVQRFGAAARGRIAVLMLVSGLTSSLGLPLATALEAHVGWRGTWALYGLIHLTVLFPLHLYASRLAGPPQRAATGAPVAPPRLGGQELALFRLLALAVSLMGLVSWGFAITTLELLRARGLDPALALTAASSIGLMQVAARATEVAFARLIPPRRSAILAAVLVAAGLTALALPGPAWACAAAFVFCYGAGSGVMAVARATLALDLFAPSAYAALMARLGLPMNLAFAAAAPLFAWIIGQAGARAALAAALALTAVALAALIALDRLARSQARDPAAAPG